MTPKVSVLLPVYNVSPFIHDTIKSLLNQSFSDFEIIVIDDLSTDNTVDIIKSIIDNRIKLIINKKNLGRAGSDMVGLQHVQGKYIAKMDGDDICRPDRLSLQVNFLDSHPEINIVGSWMQNFGASTFCNRYPEHPEDTQVLTLFTLPTGNPSVMMRSSLFREEGMYYDVSLRQTEDYDFFVRYIKEIKLHNIQDSLIKYRVPEEKQKLSILSERSSVSDDVRSAFLKSWNFPADNKALYIFNLVSMLNKPLNNLTHSDVEQWLISIIFHNSVFPIFHPQALKRGISQRWFEFCYNYPLPFARNWSIYKKSTLSKYNSLTFFQKVKFITNSLIKYIK
ncbi:glycosyltransferase family 2 protein [Hymenobacter sp. DG25B]|uniref:glycosyltransferase family 2 protein n=1 Tax=Hymenobacter sp. DG25B TaxID=1385664 RepID=UPI0006628F63|nr:glycosyltransferase family A protein [Hymenobacter sp. DG25B]